MVKEQDHKNDTVQTEKRQQKHREEKREGANHDNSAQQQNHIHVQDEEDDGTEDGGECKGHELEEMTEYERKHRALILRNQAFMQQVGLSTAKLAARTTIGNEAEKEAKRQALAARRAMKAAQLVKQPVRKSRRLGSEKVAVVSHSTDLGHPLDILFVKGMRQPYGSKVYVMDATDEEGEAFCKELAGGLDKFENDMALDIDDDIDYSLADNDVVKALPYRIITMAFLPRTDRVAVACGDKEGHVALWSPNDTNSLSAALYRPHGYRVSQLIFPDSSNLISSSIDGTVREFNLVSAKSSLVCDVNDGTGITSLIGSGNPQFYYASCEDGTLRLVDRRARKVHDVRFALHKKKINSVDQHPSLDFCIATVSQDNTVCLWNKRKISSERSVPLARLQTASFMHSAHFSPNDGFWLATVAHDSYIDLYDTSSLIKCKASDAPLTLPESIRVPHSSSTGTCTMFHPAWDPRRINRFVIGCLDQPSRLQFFRAGHPRPIHELITRTSSDVVNMYHPHLDLIASGTNGQVSLWRGKPKS